MYGLKIALVSFFSVVGLKVWPDAAPFFQERKRLGLLLFLICFCLIVFIGTTGCSQITSLLGSTPEQSKVPPVYNYRADLTISLGSSPFVGMGAMLSTGAFDITVDSIINLDRIEVQTCSRENVCQVGKDCDESLFDVDTGWFGSPGKHMAYHFYPSAVELKESCPIHIRVFDKKVLAAWGFIAFRNGEELPATFTCNGVNWKFAGHSVCQTRAGLIQQISFAEPPEEFDVDASCNLKQLDDKKTFEIRPASGLCTGKFFLGGKWHGMDVIGYNEVLVR